MTRNRQLNVRLTDAEFACLEVLRGRWQSQADLIAELAVTECERRWHVFGQACDEDGAAPFAAALWSFDHQGARGFTGRPPKLPARPPVSR